MRDRMIAGLLAGAAGTTALNAVTYGDMALRGRPASEVPERLVDRLGLRRGGRPGRRRAYTGRARGRDRRAGRRRVPGRGRAACRPGTDRPAYVDGHGLAVGRRAAPGVRVRHRRHLRPADPAAPARGPENA